MRVCNLKKLIQQNNLAVGSWVTIAHAAVPEIMAKAGFSWMAVDMEHAPVSSAQCQELIRTIDLCGMAPLVRVGTNDSFMIKQALDAGAHGVIVPMVNSAEDAQKAVNAALYPPKGQRGVGLARAQGYGQGFAEYLKKAQEETVVIIQIEHVNALDDLDGIFSVKGIDAYIIGPYDLSGSMNKPGDFDCDEMKKAMEQIKAAARKHGVPPGIHVVSSDAGKVKEKIGEGYNLIAYGVDFLFLGDSCIQGMKDIKNG